MNKHYRFGVMLNNGERLKVRKVWGKYYVCSVDYKGTLLSTVYGGYKTLGRACNRIEKIIKEHNDVLLTYSTFDTDLIDYWYRYV